MSKLFLLSKDEYMNIPKTRWIPISERPPEEGIHVLIRDIEGTVYLARRLSFGWYIAHRTSFVFYFVEEADKIKNIREWMPLPNDDIKDGK